MSSFIAGAAGASPDPAGHHHYGYGHGRSHHRKAAPERIPFVNNSQSHRSSYSVDNIGSYNQNDVYEANQQQHKSMDTQKNHTFGEKYPVRLARPTGELGQMVSHDSFHANSQRAETNGYALPGSKGNLDISQRPGSQYQTDLYVPYPWQAPP